MMYLELFHGRDSIDADMNGWGFNGPIIGPLEHVTVTYMNTIRLFFPNDKAANLSGFEGKEDNWLNLEEGLIAFQGKYYGDFSILDLTKKQVAELRKEKDRVRTKKYVKVLPEVWGPL